MVGSEKSTTFAEKLLTNNQLLILKTTITMKKLLFVAVACAAIFGMSSCKKSCTCTIDGVSVTLSSDDMRGVSCSDLSDVYEAEGVGSCK